jgi:cbb3-type cytochrome oxidase maturation protein
MSVLYIAVPVALMLALGALGGFIWSVSDGQMDDLDTPQHRMLDDE